MRRIATCVVLAFACTNAAAATPPPAPAGGIVLTLGNAILKPILAILTLPLIIVTFGLFYFVINVAMLALAEWVAPDFSINGFWTYVGATIVVWFVNVVMQWVLDRVRLD